MPAINCRPDSTVWSSEKSTIFAAGTHLQHLLPQHVASPALSGRRLLVPRVVGWRRIALALGRFGLARQ
eukprot:6712899-Prymnesium_polylepis.1